MCFIHVSSIHVLCGAMPPMHIHAYVRDDACSFTCLSTPAINSCIDLEVHLMW